MTRVGQATGPPAGDPDGMLRETSWTDVVLFELPGFAHSAELCERLTIERLAWIEVSEGRRHVAVMLRPEAGDLAVLLRTVEGWVEGRGLVAIRFELDGREYVLEGGQAVWSSVPG